MRLLTRALLPAVVAAQVRHGLHDVNSRRAPPRTPESLFDFEKTQLSTPSPAPAASAGAPPRASADRLCKPFPGDEDWPDYEQWRSLDSALNGSLLEPAPAASVCYNVTVYDNYNQNSCQTLLETWARDFVRMNHPIEVVSPLMEGLTCLPPSEGISAGSCVQGGYPSYVANVSIVAHIQAAVNFARDTGVRLVIKNTGHDFSGKSLGAGSLSIWTHGLKDIRFYENYTCEGYTGPAFKVGAGVQAGEILKVAHDAGYMVVTGICDSVGIFGGYSQGGGHSPLSSLHGMGADQVLSLNVVTADGKFITASPSENTDLFWAIRGGGGSTFGVVTSMVIKAYPDAYTSVATFSWAVRASNISTDTFWKGVSSYFSYFENFTAQGLFAQFNMLPDDAFPGPANSDASPSISVSPFLGVGKSLEQLRAAVEPWIEEMGGLGIAMNTSWAGFSSYYPAYFSQLASTETALMPYNMAYGSRLIPRENFDKTKKLNATVAAYRTMAENRHAFNGFQYSPTLENGSPVGSGGNAVLPAWRNALSHTIAFLSWPEDSTASEQLAIRKAFATGPAGMQLLRHVTPASGSYMSEADRLEPDFQRAFFGDNYERLLDIKRKYDPDDVFYAVTAVGSERWAVKSVDGLPTENGPLCLVAGAPASHN